MTLPEKQKSDLIRQLTKLGFADIDAIISSAYVITEGNADGSIRVNRLVLTDPTTQDGLSFVFVAKEAKGELWEIEEISAFHRDLNTGMLGNRPEYHISGRGGDLPNKLRMLDVIEAQSQLVQIKEGLRNNPELANQLLSIGFSDHLQMIHNATVVFNRLILSCDYDLGPDVGTGSDSVHFNIWLGSIKETKAQKIKVIYASYQSSVPVINDPEFRGSEIFSDHGGGFPNICQMSNVLIVRHRDWLLKAAAAYRVAENIKNAPGGLRRQIRPPG